MKVELQIATPVLRCSRGTEPDLSSIQRIIKNLDKYLDLYKYKLLL